MTHAVLLLEIDENKLHKNRNEKINVLILKLVKQARIV